MLQLFCHIHKVRRAINFESEEIKHLCVSAHDRVILNVFMQPFLILSLVTRYAKLKTRTEKQSVNNRFLQANRNLESRMSNIQLQAKPVKRNPAPRGTARCYRRNDHLTVHKIDQRLAGLTSD